jgi:hypothetical protein
VTRTPNTTPSTTPAPDRPDFAPERDVTERELDAAVEESFPASDPPAHSLDRPTDTAPPSASRSCPCSPPAAPGAATNRGSP